MKHLAVEPVSFTGDLLWVVSPEPCAPGSPLMLELPGLTVRAKSHGTKKRGDGRFDLRVRLVTLPRPQRRKLLALVGQSPT